MRCLIRGSCSKSQVGCSSANGISGPYQHKGRRQWVRHLLRVRENFGWWWCVWESREVCLFDMEAYYSAGKETMRGRSSGLPAKWRRAAWEKDRGLRGSTSRELCWHYVCEHLRKPRESLGDAISKGQVFRQNVYFSWTCSWRLLTYEHVS